MNNMSRTTPLFEPPFQAPPPLRRERPEDYGIYDAAFENNVEEWYTSLPLERKLHYLALFSMQTQNSIGRYREMIEDNTTTVRTGATNVRLGAQYPNEQIHPLERDISSRGPQQLSPLIRQSSMPMPEYDFGESTIHPDTQSTMFMSRNNGDIVPMDIEQADGGRMILADLDVRNGEGPMTLEELELPNDNDI
jgi:hypothetical protein